MKSMEQLVKYDVKSPESIESYAQKLIGKTFLNVVRESSLDEQLKAEKELEYGNPKRKGGMGILLEEVYFGYKANSDQRPDFPEAGVELKVTPYDIKKKAGKSAGERIVITMIPFDAPIESDFEQSHAYEKLKLILLVYYWRNKELGNNLLYPIEYVKLFSPPEEDLKIIRDDYAKIVNKVQAGKAHELSEGDTMYLGACTKGSTAEKSLVAQYYAPELRARKRAFCFKTSYANYIFKKYILGDIKTYESIVQSPEELEKLTFEQLIVSKIEQHTGKTDRELCAEFNRPYNNNKAQWSDLAFRMLGVRSNQAEEFEKANIKVKSIRILENGSMRESMSFPAIDFIEFAQEEWEESELYRYFEETRFLFVVYRQIGKEYILKGCQLWNMPTRDLEETVFEGWKMNQDCIIEGVQFTKKMQKNGLIIENNLPKKEDNPIVHLRPHSSKRFYDFGNGEIVGEKRSYGAPLPDGRWMTQQSFWINNTYILSQLEERLKTE